MGWKSFSRSGLGISRRVFKRAIIIYFKTDSLQNRSSSTHVLDRKRREARRMEHNKIDTLRGGLCKF